MGEKDDEFQQDLDEIAATFAFGDATPPAPEPKVEPTTPATPAPAPAPQAEPSQSAPAPTPSVEPPVPVSVQPPAALPGLDGAAPQTPAAPASDPRDLQIASLQAQMEALQVALQSKPTPDQSTPETPEQELARLVKPEEYAYKLSIPDQVLQAVFNEDAGVAANGMHHLINNLASIIHRNVLVQARKDLSQYKHEVENSQVNSNFEKQKNDAQADYYATFPSHSEPVIKLIVAQEAQKLGNEYPQLPWGDQFKNALGARVNAQLAVLRGQPVPQAGPTPVTSQTAPTPKPASFLPVGTAPSGIPHFENDQDVIASTFSFGS